MCWVQVWIPVWKNREQSWKRGEKIIEGSSKPQAHRDTGMAEEMRTPNLN